MCAQGHTSLMLRHKDAYVSFSVQSGAAASVAVAASTPEAHLAQVSDHNAHISSRRFHVGHAQFCCVPELVRG